MPAIHCASACITAGTSLLFYTFTTYMQKYLVNTAGMSIRTASTVMTCCLFLSMCMQPLFGALSDRVALVGHSAGANAVVDAGNDADLAKDVDVVVSLAGSATLTRPGVSFLAMAGTSDGVVRLSSSTSAWEQSSTPRRLVTLENAPAKTNNCTTNQQRPEPLRLLISRFRSFVLSRF